MIGYGTDEFPAFFTPQSGCQVRHLFLNCIFLMFSSSTRRFDNYTRVGRTNAKSLGGVLLLPASMEEFAPYVLLQNLCL